MGNQKLIIKSLETIASGKIVGAIGHKNVHAFETRALHDAPCNVSVICICKSVISICGMAEVWNADQDMTS